MGLLRIFILRSIIVMAVIFSLFLPVHTLAAEYNWLKTKEYEKLFIYTDFNECNIMADRLNETLKKILSYSHIKSAISDSLVFQMTDKEEESVKELLDDRYIKDNKIIMHIYGKCIKYNSAYIYQFDIHFGRLDKNISQALLFSSPHYSVMGIDIKSGIDIIFRRLLEGAVSDYLTANKPE